MARPGRLMRIFRRALPVLAPVARAIPAQWQRRLKNWLRT